MHRPVTVLFYLGNIRMKLWGFSALIFVSLIARSASAGAPPPPICGHGGASFFSNAAPAQFPSNNTGVFTSQITVSGLPVFLWDVDVTTFIKHTASTDIDMTITSPQGTVVTLTTDNGSNLDNLFFGTLWDDQANPGGQVPYESNGGLVSDRQYVNNQTAPALVPEEPLSAMFGENPNGVWTLSINDDGNAAEVGSLFTWALDIEALKQAPTMVTIGGTNDTDFAIPLSAPPNVISSQITISDPNLVLVCGVQVNTQITHSFPGDIDMTVQSPSGRVVTLTTDNGSSADNIFANTTWKNLVNGAGSLPFTSQSGVVTDAVFSAGTPVPQLSPEESLAAFHGEVGNGNWTLTISDDANLDGGTLSRWDLTLTRCSEPDSDSDGVPESCDGCPSDPAKSSPGACGCGSVDTDDDGDGTANCNDACPANIGKIAAGQCGCAVADTDSDSDGTADCNDACVSDRAKTAPGTCGCGVADTDLNANGVLDCLKSGELKARVNSAISLLAKVKLTKGKLNTSAKTAKTSLTALLKDIASFIGTDGASVTVIAGKNLNSLNSSVQSKVKKALKSITSSNKSAANKALKQLRDAISA